MRIPESEELARLVELYGREEALRRLAERKAERELIKPWVAAGMNSRRIAKRLARMRHPELYPW